MKRVLIALGLIATAATAQAEPASQALVVSVCGTPPWTYVAGTVVPLTMDLTGKLCDSATGGGGGGGTSSNFGAAFPATGTAIGVSDGTNMQPLTIDGSNNLNVNINAATAAITLGVGTNIVGKVGIDQTTAGTTNAVSVAYWGTHAVTVDGSGLPEISASNLFTTDEAAFTAGSTGFSSIGGFFQTTATSNALTNGQSGMAQMTANRALMVNLRDAAGVALAGAAGTAATPVLTVQGIASMTKLLVTPDANSAVNVAQVAGTTTSVGNGSSDNGTQRVAIAPNALTTFFLQPTASDNHANIKNGAGTVYNVVAFNISATVNYIRLYNVATGFNGCNSATGLITQFQVPALTTVGGFSVSIPQGLAFSTGISICVTSGYATTDTTNATATAMSVTVGYL